MFLIDDLLLLPIDGMKFVFRTLLRAAEEEWTDDAPLKEQLMELQLKLDNGDITEDQYVELERAILAELREVGKRKRALAGVTEEEEAEFSAGVPITNSEGARPSFVVESNLGPRDES